MATFPAIMPLRREWEFPNFPTIDYEGIGGNTTSFEFGSSQTDQSLQLIYELINNSEMQQIRDHFLEQQSVHPFTLPTVVIGETGIFDPETLWLYADEPEEKLVNIDLYNISISLRSILL